MLEMICAIPENVGWVIVGIAGTLCVEMFIALGKTIYFAIKEHREECEE